MAGIVICLSLLFLVGSVGGAPLQSETKTVTVVDGDSEHVEVTCPVERIICYTSGSCELICAFGDEDKIVGRCGNAIYPSLLEEKTVVGKSCCSPPNSELLLEQKPDVAIGCGGLRKVRENLEAAGVPVILECPRKPDHLIPLINNLGLILDKKERADEIAGFVEHYWGLVDERVEKLEPEEKPSVLWFYYKPDSSVYKTFAPGSPTHDMLVKAGGINIAGGEPVRSPKVSAEWVMERNPDVIVAYVSKDILAGGIDEMWEVRDEIMSRPELNGVKAVEEDKVHLIAVGDITAGVRCPIGLLYLAKWFHPDLFEDVDPEAVHRDMVQKFYGLELEGVYVYP